MKFRYHLTACVVALLPTSVLACEPPAVFHAPFQARSNASVPAEIAAYVARTKPVIRTTSLARGAPGESSMCGGMGYINVEIALPPGAPYTLGQVGAEITLAEGQFHDHVFPKGPVMPIDPGADSPDIGNARTKDRRRSISRSARCSTCAWSRRMARAVR